ncbi:hypothetical protein OS493_005451 [Desmophyllum pertusum]|uniref:Uncharacterized protein n=1 Tax=Desmophyllum pertusum TaxID=174260 RepID=A0A9W9YSA2_9CNID|nr:hypothetical protein OS493_005451 [Desmophyllum pertusum]
MAFAAKQFVLSLYIFYGDCQQGWAGIAKIILKSATWSKSSKRIVHVQRSKVQGTRNVLVEEKLRTAVKLPTIKMSDVEQWIKSCVSEAGAEKSRISKEELWESFSSLTKVEVGREIFFSYLGISLSNMGYNNKLCLPGI